MSWACGCGAQAEWLRAELAEARALLVRAQHHMMADDRRPWAAWLHDRFLSKGRWETAVSSARPDLFATREEALATGRGVPWEVTRAALLLGEEKPPA